MKVKELKSFLTENGYKLYGKWGNTLTSLPAYRGELFYSHLGKAFKKKAVCYNVELDIGLCSFVDNANVEIGLNVKVKIGSSPYLEKNLFSINEISSFIAQAEDEYLSNRVISIR
jgi:hypothetical protein